MVAGPDRRRQGENVQRSRLAEKGASRSLPHRVCCRALASQLGVRSRGWAAGGLGPRLGIPGRVKRSSGMRVYIDWSPRMPRGRGAAGTPAPGDWEIVRFIVSWLIVGGLAGVSLSVLFGCLPAP